MSRKTTASYIAVFKYIEEKIFQLKPISFMTDYERAMRRGLYAVYPNATLNACWFHYSQAVGRKASKIPNFFKELAKDENLDRIYHKFLAFPLLPHAQTLNAFAMLKLAIDCRSKTHIFEPFIRYFSKQWLEKVSNNKKINLYKCVAL
jgi:hypothetical protein